MAILRALAALTEAADAGAAGGLALVGFDDFELADLLGITVVAQDPARLGRTAADLLFMRLAGNEEPTSRIELATRLVPRGSGERPLSGRRADPPRRTTTRITARITPPITTQGAAQVAP